MHSPDDRAPPLLAVARIVCVLGMSLGVSLFIFLALGGWFLTAAIALATSLPFFTVMRYMEKRYMRETFGPDE